MRVTQGGYHTEIKAPARPLDDYANNETPNVEQEHVDQLPAEQSGDWHIEMRYLPSRSQHCDSEQGLGSRLSGLGKRRARSNL